MNRNIVIFACPLLVAVALFGITTGATHAQVVAPSVYTTTIQVQGETAGTEFADWAASGITVADADPVDNPGGSPPFIDIGNVQVANDANYIYIHATMHGAITSLANLFLAFDTDQNLATGFDPFGLGVVGSELGYQTDFPFGQATAVFNTNATLTGGPFGNGGALIYPFWTEAGAPQGTEIEWAIPLNVTINGPPAFPSDSFDFAIWTDNGLGDITQRISYTLAEARRYPRRLQRRWQRRRGRLRHLEETRKHNYHTSQRSGRRHHRCQSVRHLAQELGMSTPGTGGSGSPVPEPSTLSAFVIAAIVLSVMSRKLNNELRSVASKARRTEKQQCLTTTQTV